MMALQRKLSARTQARLVRYPSLLEWVAPTRAYSTVTPVSLDRSRLYLAMRALAFIRAALASSSEGLLPASAISFFTFSSIAFISVIVLSSLKFCCVSTLQGYCTTNFGKSQDLFQNFVKIFQNLLCSLYPMNPLHQQKWSALLLSCSIDSTPAKSIQ